ncbi:hypothetical protein G7046_g9476 [Stylonectria norvegica]|nr:hypothetical protein G7046_g9476 [Stylonectria norvegica]
MRSVQAFAILSLLTHGCLSASVDFWSGRRSVESRDQIFESIEPEELLARLGTTPDEYHPEERHEGTVYFCRDENWGPPCYAYTPGPDYQCQQLNEELTKHVGSVFVEVGTICRLSRLAYNDQCAGLLFAAWPETKNGWDDLFHRPPPGSDVAAGDSATHIMCTKCTNCVER